MRMYDEKGPKLTVTQGMTEVIARATEMLADSGVGVLEAFAELERNPNTDNARITEVFGLWKMWKRLLIVKNAEFEKGLDEEPQEEEASGPPQFFGVNSFLVGKAPPNFHRTETAVQGPRHQARASQQAASAPRSRR